MKKIGILHGKESSFPEALVERINQKNIEGIIAEDSRIGNIFQAEPIGYDVILDRISQDVPFYKAVLKNAAICGTAVVNNPFWWSADEKFFNNCLAVRLGVPVPKTVLVPSHQMPPDTDANSFRNLIYPMDWEKIFDYTGMPVYMKPHSGGGWKSVYQLDSPENLFKAHAETGELVMMVQEEIVFTEYFRCYCVGMKEVHIMQYEPRNPHHLRYVIDGPPVAKKLLKTIEDYVLKLCQALGYELNTVEFAVRDGIPYAIDFCNPAPDADIKSVGAENFEWIVEHMANYLILRAQNHKAEQSNLAWGSYVKNSIKGKLF